MRARCSDRCCTKAGGCDCIDDVTALFQSPEKSRNVLQYCLAIRYVAFPFRYSLGICLHEVDRYAVFHECLYANPVAIFFMLSRQCRKIVMPRCAFD